MFPMFPMDTKYVAEMERCYRSIVRRRLRNDAQGSETETETQYLGTVLPWL